ncbi:helix-turn-helix transcriptional regulator [Agrobacterium tumefaciens]|uniref:helix-turn-helix domain-containing protein n=1 Tax=Agrobacterium tumefaciens TaxID=358 RepID=UPI0015748317|nr:helix-turn-helix transcriptional regulator [Agrobacterium tumefaciens]NSX87644.1 helix-turn-helix transcriptional regulator [Agrobacterium tumefaciens]
MSQKTDNRIAEVRKKRGLTQAQLAEKLGVHWVTISKLERGIMQLTSDWIERLAEALEVEVLELWGGSLTRLLHVDGEIKRGSEISLLDDGESRSYSTYINPLGDFTSAWVIVGDDAMEPFFHMGDMLNFVIFADSEWKYLLGRLCTMVIEDTPTLGVIIGLSGKIADIRLMNGRVLKEQVISEVSCLAGFLPGWSLKQE